MSVLGVDFSTRGIDFVALDDDTDKAEWVHFPVPDKVRKRGPFYAARWLAGELPGPRGTFWERHGIWLVGVEDPVGHHPHTQKALGLVCGAVAASLPAEMPVILTRPSEWKRLTCENAQASKETVRAWGLERGFGWAGMETQDAFDAYAIAWAVRALNERAVAETRRTA